MTEFGAMLRAAGPETLKIKAQYDEWHALYAEEDAVLKKIAGSAHTAEIREADHARDRVFRGMTDAHDAALNHFTHAVSEAARRLEPSFKAYGNVAKLSIDEETSAIHNLVQELAVNHPVDAEMTGLMPWITELDRLNIALSKLTGERYDEDAGRTGVTMKQVRARIDEAYHVLVLCIEAQSVMTGGAVYTDFIARLNAVVAHYNTLLARQQGRRDAQKDDEAVEAVEIVEVAGETVGDTII